MQQSLLNIRTRKFFSVLRMSLLQISQLHILGKFRQNLNIPCLFFVLIQKFGLWTILKTAQHTQINIVWTSINKKIWTEIRHPPNITFFPTFLTQIFTFIHFLFFNNYFSNSLSTNKTHKTKKIVIHFSNLKKETYKTWHISGALENSIFSNLFFHKNY